MFKAEIYIKLKKGVVDPQGLAVKQALESLGYSGLRGVRMGKIADITFDCKDKKMAQGVLEDMCRKLLANPVIENYSFKIKKELR